MFWPMHWHRNWRGIMNFTLATVVISILFDPRLASASSTSPLIAIPTSRSVATGGPESVTTAKATSSAIVIEPPIGEKSISGETEANAPSSSSVASNPIGQLLTYVKDSMANFKNGMSQMNADHRRCNEIRAKQRIHAKENGFTRPRGLKGIQVGGISYDEYDFLRKGLIDRNKLLAVSVVALCLPNYFVYYLWSFPDMLPSPFLKVKDANDVSRERCHAVVSTLLEIEKGARIAPFMAKLNPFGGRATERAMKRLGQLGQCACEDFEKSGVVGPKGMSFVMNKLKGQLYTDAPPSKQRMLLTGNTIPKQILKGLGKVISADPLSKGSSPFGVGVIKHVESVTLCDEFLVEQKVNIGSIKSDLLAEACSARLIGGPGWTDEERKEALLEWLQQAEIQPQKEAQDGAGHFNGNLARAALMCYNAIDATRDSRSDSRLPRLMYQGQLNEALKS